MYPLYSFARCFSSLVGLHWSLSLWSLAPVAAAESGRVRQHDGAQEPGPRAGGAARQRCDARQLWRRLRRGAQPVPYVRALSALLLSALILPPARLLGCLVCAS